MRQAQRTMAVFKQPFIPHPLVLTWPPTHLEAFKCTFSSIFVPFALLSKLSRINISLHSLLSFYIHVVMVKPHMYFSIFHALAIWCFLSTASKSIEIIFVLFSIFIVIVHTFQETFPNPIIPILSVNFMANFCWIWDFQNSNIILQHKTLYI